MSEDVASRVAGAEALTPELRERVERAAARLGSIHERWVTPMPAEPIVAAVEASASSSPDDALPLDADAVSVTPILGIETDESDDAGRPRFKTLMGVPRSSPEIDDLAGLDSPIERPALRSLPAAASSERASSRVDEAPSLAGTSLPWESGAPPSPSTRVSPAPWPSLADSSLDVSAEVAALRIASRRRPWWIGLGAIAAAAAVFAIVAPRQRTRALHWVQSEYRTRLHPAATAISDTARALRPVASTTSSTSTDRAMAQLEPSAAVPPRAAGQPASEPSDVREMAAPAGTLAEDSSALVASTKSPIDDPTRNAHISNTPSRESSQEAETSAALSSAGAESSATKRKPAARDARSGGTTSRARAQVAAPRKPSQRGDNQQSASGTNVAVRSTKARATRQNRPRKDSGSGIIRETPF